MVPMSVRSCVVFKAWREDKLARLAHEKGAARRRDETKREESIFQSVGS